MLKRLFQIEQERPNELGSMTARKDNKKNHIEAYRAVKCHIGSHGHTWPYRVILRHTGPYRVT